MPESALLEGWKSFENLYRNLENGAPDVNMLGTQIIGKFRLS